MRSTKFRKLYGRIAETLNSVERGDAPSQNDRHVVRSLPGWIKFMAQKVFEHLSLSNQCEPIAAHQRFCREKTRIIVRRHGKSVCARAHDREQIALMQFRHFTPEGKEISRLAHRADNVDLLSLTHD